jgi:fructokinase
MYSGAALVIGEALVDVVRGDDSQVEYPGGSAANVAVALARLGRPTWLATSFATDEYGVLLANHLARNDVQRATDPGAVSRTSSAVATLDAGGAATYAFDLQWRLNPVELPAKVVPAVVHACSIGAVLEPGAVDVLGEVQRFRSVATVSYDLNLRPSITGTGPEVVARVEKLVAHADVVKASDEDLETLSPDASWEETAERLLTLGPTAVVVTRGRSGASVLRRAGRVDVPAVRVRVADTIGAGDTFGAALLDALMGRGLLGASRREALADLDDAGWHEVVSAAVRAAAVTVSRPGADPPTRAELA